MKMKLVGLLVITLLITTAVIPIVNSENIVEKSVEDEKQIDKSTVNKVVKPSLLPPWLLKIFNGDWNYWNNPPDMYTIPEGNVGIGIATPAEKLDILGTVQMTGFKMPTGASNGYVLTTDENGIGSWVQLPSGEGIGGNGTINYIPKFIGMTTIGNSIIYEINNKIGIGVENPDSILEVDGIIHTRSGGFKFSDDTTQNTAAFGDGHSLDSIDNSPTDVVYVNEDGNVGIGTTNPQDKLHVDGTVNATSYIGNGSQLWGIPSMKPYTIYSGDGFNTDIKVDESGNEEASYEFNPISSDFLNEKDYLRIEITGTCRTRSEYDRLGEVEIKIQTKNIGGDYTDSLIYTTIHLTKKRDVDENTQTSTFTFTYYHTLTSEEKMNGVQVKIFSKSTALYDAAASFTNIQTVITAL